MNVASQDISQSEKLYLKNYQFDRNVIKIESCSEVFGNPARLVSDIGSTFTAIVSTENVKKYKIDHISSATIVPKRKWTNCKNHPHDIIYHFRVFIRGSSQMV